MKKLRQLHLYLGCLFAPMILYFALSGSWQVFRWNDVPKPGQMQSQGHSPLQGHPMLRSILHELSKPHKSSTLPRGDTKSDRSVAFSWAVIAMSVGLIVTTAIGILLALRQSRSPAGALLCLLIGVFLPVVLLFLR